jgi:hypothetical protein
VAILKKPAAMPPRALPYIKLIETVATIYGSHDAGVCARYFRARALALLGRLDEAVRTAERERKRII